MSTPQGQTCWRDFICLGNLQLLSNSYSKVPFLFVIKGEVSFSLTQVSLAGSELLQTLLDLRLWPLLCVALPGSASPLTQNSSSQGLL